MQTEAKTFLLKQGSRLNSEDELFKTLDIERPKPAKVEVKPQVTLQEKVPVKEETKAAPKAELKAESKKPVAK